MRRTLNSPRGDARVMVGVAAALLIGGCQFLPRDLGELVFVEPGKTITLTLSTADDGRLEHCQGERCTRHDNPEGCHTYEARLNDVTGAVCETCLDEQKNVLSARCEGTLLTCTVATAPDPDCVVCAFNDGAVVFSSCKPRGQLECAYFSPTAPGGGASSTDGDACTICYDELQRPVISMCPDSCSAVVCPDRPCEDGFQAVRQPGECCDRCVPTTSCEAQVCPFELTIPSCPEGTKLVRDAADCCFAYCQPMECPDDSNLKIACPPGYEWTNSYPNCGRCVRAPQEPATCIGSKDCDPGNVCSTEWGDCQKPPCASQGGCVGPAVCYGVCLPQETSCPELAAPAIACEGKLESPGLDKQGCPLPPVCRCPDGSIAVDGACDDLCAKVSCIQMVETCAPGQRLDTSYPNCCGICVPDDMCVAGEDIGTSTESYRGSISCPKVSCGPQLHTELGPDCCEVCVRNVTPCDHHDDCLAHERCDMSTGAKGQCVSKVVCEDSDGIDFFARGTTSGVRVDGEHYQASDHCLDEHTVVERYCYQPFESSTVSLATSVTYDCPNGCHDGACLP